MNLCAYWDADDRQWIHAAGCTHQRTQRPADVRPLGEHATRQAAADFAWADCIREGSMTPADALAEVSFAPCAKALA